MFETNVKFLLISASVLVLFFLSGCRESNPATSDVLAVNIIFLHHSTGHVVWKGQSTGLGKMFGKKEAVPGWFEDYNKWLLKNP